MFKILLIFLFIQQILSTDEQITSLSEHPLFIKTIGLLDRLLEQVRNMQQLINRTYKMFENIPYNVRPYFAECFTMAHNISRIEYSLNLNTAEIKGIPQIRDQLKQATTFEQQLIVMNKTDSIVADISLNIIKPSMAFISEIIDCLQRKF